MSEKNNYYAHPSAIIDEGAEIGEGSKIWHFCHLMPGCVLGKNCNLGQNVFVATGVQLGDGAKVQNNVSLYTGIICEANVFLGPSMVFTNVINPRSGIERKSEYKTTYVEEGVTIGANATIVCGVRLGKYSFIGAGAVVTKDVPAYALMVGTPGRIVGYMSEYGQKLFFDEKGEAICPESGQKYIKIAEAVSRIS